jgi:pantetheine-phosphate adenylyltransferase
MSRSAVYPGSFDPPTNGHLDIIERASRLFDELYVTVFAHPDKPGWLSVPDRVDAIRRATVHLPNVRAEKSQELLVRYCRKVGAAAIVRGLRGPEDLSYEWSMTLMNARLDPAVETVFLASTTWPHVSASRVRELARYGVSLAELVPAPVLELLIASGKVGEERSDGQDGPVGIGTGQPD